MCFSSIGSPASNGEPAANRGEPATSSIVRQYSDRVKVAQYGGQSSAGSYPPGLIDAAVWACSGLAVSAGEFLASLDPNDYDGVIASPEVARAHAKAIGG